MSILANLRLFQAGPVKCLAGHDSGTGESVYVLRRIGDSDRYTLHLIDVAKQAELRSILASDQAIAGELASAIAETTSNAKPKRRRASKKAPTKNRK